MSMSEAWKIYGIVDPEKTLKEHGDRCIRSMGTLVDAYGVNLSPAIKEHIAGMILVGYAFGVSAGRMEALEYPGMALRAEFELLRELGMSDGQLAEAIREAMAAKSSAS
jgi:hypothetical protein